MPLSISGNLTLRFNFSTSFQSARPRCSSPLRSAPNTRPAMFARRWMCRSRRPNVGTSTVKHNAFAPACAARFAVSTTHFSSPSGIELKCEAAREPRVRCPRTAAASRCSTSIRQPNSAAARATGSAPSGSTSVRLAIGASSTGRRCFIRQESRRGSRMPRRCAGRAAETQSNRARAGCG